MRKDLIEILACPMDKSPLTLQIDEENGDEVIQGALVCTKCGERYPIEDRIPNLLPPDLEVVRIVDIVGLDTQADGGTHVASTSQIGRIEVVKVENKGKGFRRLRIRLVDGS